MCHGHDDHDDSRYLQHYVNSVAYPHVSQHIAYDNVAYHHVSQHIAYDNVAYHYVSQHIAYDNEHAPGGAVRVSRRLGYRGGARIV